MECPAKTNSHAARMRGLDAREGIFDHINCLLLIKVFHAAPFDYYRHNSSNRFAFVAVYRTVF